MATDNSKKSSKKTGEGMSSQDKENLMLILSYLGPLTLIPYFSAKDSKIVSFHARQGMALLVIWAALWVLGSFFASFFLFLGVFVYMIAQLASLGVFALSIWGLINALGKKEVKLPIASQLADTLKL